MRKNTIRTFIGLVLIICLVSTIQPVQAATRSAVPLADNAFNVTADSSAKSGIAGSVVTYTFTVTNLTGTDKSITISDPVSVSSWTPAPAVNESSLNVAASGTAYFSMNVPIPSAATAGQNDIESVTISDGVTSTTLTVTTTVKAVAVPGRPVIMVAGYWVNNGKLSAGNDFQLALKLQNSGGGIAENVVVSYDGGTSFYPKSSGGMESLASIGTGSKKVSEQWFTCADELAWLDIVTIKATVSYTDNAGTAYSDVFTLTFDVDHSGNPLYYATATPAAASEPQLVITNYKVDVDPLQPGSIFSLSMDVKNMGKTDAQAVTMILGGGGSSSSDSGTPAAGGVAGAGSELTNFAPMNSSNLLYVGNISSGSTVTLTQKLIVNVTTAPGVYPLKFSFVYADAKGNKVVDDQMITLLVYSLPQLDVSFYRDPGIFSVGMPTTLPIQVTNLGKKTNVLGNMKVTADGETITNDVSLVGSLDPGGYYTLDSEITPSKEGLLEITVTINYNDDFNQARTLVQTISVNVEPAQVITAEPGTEGSVTGKPVDQAPESFWHKVGRFFKGLIGLDSASNTATATPEPTVPGGPAEYPRPKG